MVGNRAWLRGAFLACAIAVLAPAGAAAYLSPANGSPFPTSKVIVSARWSTQRYGPPGNQRGDILPTIWGDDGNTYVMMDDGGTDIPVSGALWRQSLAQITGSPPHLRFHHIGDPKAPPPHTWAQIHAHPNLWRGPLGPYYSSGFVQVDNMFYATQERDWNWHGNGLFTGLAGIAYSSDHGHNWKFGAKSFPAPLGNLTWLARGRGGAHPDGYVYAFATEREFNASTMIMGRTQPGTSNLTDPGHWQWVSGWSQSAGSRVPVWSSSLKAAIAILPWHSHITYPQMSYDAPLHRYLLSFTYSYSSRRPTVWTGGAELVILESPRPWGPFSFVAREHNFGPSNGYDPGFPLNWISSNGRDLWLKWAANWDGCVSYLNCAGAYGFNYRRMHLTVASPTAPTSTPPSTTPPSVHPPASTPTTVSPPPATTANAASPRGNGPRAWRPTLNH